LNYNFKTQNLQISFVDLNYGFRSDVAFTEIGINYPFYQTEPIKINSGIGYQAAFGFDIAENIIIGFRYSVFNASYTQYDSYYGIVNYSISYALPTFFVSIK
jgi:hypothetical protein